MLFIPLLFWLAFIYSYAHFLWFWHIYFFGLGVRVSNRLNEFLLERIQKSLFLEFLFLFVVSAVLEIVLFVVHAFFDLFPPFNHLDLLHLFLEHHAVFLHDLLLQSRLATLLCSLLVRPVLVLLLHSLDVLLRSFFLSLLKSALLEFLLNRRLVVMTCDQSVMEASISVIELARLRDKTDVGFVTHLALLTLEFRQHFTLHSFVLSELSSNAMGDLILLLLYHLLPLDQFDLLLQFFLLLLQLPLFVKRLLSPDFLGFLIADSFFFLLKLIPQSLLLDFLSVTHGFPSPLYLHLS